MANALLLPKERKKYPLRRRRGKKVAFVKPPKARAIDPATDVAGVLVQGQQASSYEVYVARALDKLGVEYTFQYAIGGGRSRRGGQMLDFVVWSAITWVLDVRGGWWHRGSELEFEQAVRRYMKAAHVLVLGDAECRSETTALSFLRQNGVS